MQRCKWDGHRYIVCVIMYTQYTSHQVNNRKQTVCLVSAVTRTVCLAHWWPLRCTPQAGSFICSSYVQTQIDSIYRQKEISWNHLEEIKGKWERCWEPTVCLVLHKKTSLCARNDLVRRELLPLFRKCENSRAQVQGAVWKHTDSWTGVSCRPGSPGACVSFPHHASKPGI